MKTNFRVSEELNQNIHIDIESSTESEEKSIERTNDGVSEEESNENMAGGPLLRIDESNIDFNESIEAIGNMEEDPLFIIDEPNQIANVDVIEPIDESEGIDNEEGDAEENVVFVPGLPERNVGGRPAHGQLVCDLCGYIASQMSRLLAHMDSHSAGKKYKCEWIDQDGIVCDKKYKKQKELTAHQRLKKHRIE